MPTLSHSAKAACVVATSFFVFGCATVTTTRPDTDNVGIAYHLPEAWFKLTVTEVDGALTALVTAPIMAPDPSAQLISNIPAGAFSDNKVSIGVDPKTNLLTSFTATSVGKADDIITGAIKSALNLQGAATSSGTIIFDAIYPLTPKGGNSASQSASAHIRSYVLSQCNGRELAEAEKPRCSALSTLTSANKLPLMITVGDEVAPAPASSSGDQRVTEAQTFAAMAERTTRDLPKGCAKGLCYRPMVPRIVQLAVGEVSRSSDIVLVPDTATVNWINLPSGFFATQKYTVTFTEGFPTTFERDGQSELVGLVKLPLTVIKAIISAPAEALGFKKSALEAETNYLSTVGTNAAKVKEVSDLCKDGPTRCPGTAAKLIRAGTSETKGPDLDGGNDDGDDDIPVNP
jgi:hypothetical protein